MNETNTTTTLSPTIKPTNSPTTEEVTTTLSPTPSPTQFFTTTLSPTNQPTTFVTTSNPTSQVEIIELPDYRSKDPVDGIFIVFVSLLFITLFVVCFETFWRRKKRSNASVQDTNRALRQEFSMSYNDSAERRRSREIHI